MSLKGFADLSTLAKTFYGVMACSGVLLSSIYMFASFYFVNIEKFSPVENLVDSNASQIQKLFVLLNDTVQVNHFKQYTYETDISDATERLKQLARFSESRPLTLYEISQVDYLTDSILRWQAALEVLINE